VSHDTCRLSLSKNLLATLHGIFENSNRPKEKCSIFQNQVIFELHVELF